MIRSLSVNNFALIDHVQIDFASGLNILTGETGAGKSILIDALGAILGERASTESIRSGCDYFRVEAVVDTSGREVLASFLDEQGIPCEEDTLIISRRLTRSGKNTVTVNGCQATLSVLRQIGELLVDMHGQHENQALLRPHSHLALVDQFADINEILAAYSSAFREWRQICTELADHDKRSRERERRIEMLSWQTEEIEQAALQPGEDERCQQEIRLLGNIEKVAQAVAHAYLLLKQAERGSPVVSVLGEIRRELESAARYDESLQPKAAVIAECLYQLDDLADELRIYADSFDSDPGRLHKLEERMDVIQSLKKKYGATIEEVLAYQQQASQELAELQSDGRSIEKLAARLQQLQTRLAELAAKLDHSRRCAAAQLQEAVTGHLRELGMTNAVFSVRVDSTEAFMPTGCNDVFCLFSANRGEEPKPLQKVASGGELSRIALAIKSVNAYRDIVGTVIFDEVDSGIGGKTAQMVAEKIAFVAMAKQVLCITHSPAIASMADRHFIVEKHTQSDRTVTLVRQLMPPERVLELARMVGGDETSQIAVENAREMIETSAKKKEKRTKRA